MIIRKNIFIILFLVIGLGMIIYYGIKNNNLEKNRINIHDITSSGAKSQNVNVYLNASYLAGNIANYENDNKNSFYVVFGDDVQYLVYMKNNLAKKINNYLLDNPTNTYKIVGVTKKIPSSLEKYGRDFVKKWLDTNHHHEETDDTHSHEITVDEFYEYFGYVYLDNTSSDSIRYILYISLLSFLISIIMILGRLKLW